MANGVKDLRSIALHDLIGAPIVAVVRAQAEAARATVEFVEAVGLTADRVSEEDAGALRMAEFRYTKLDENGSPAEFVARVPVLSLVPIPALQIRTARLSFAARITDAVSEPAPPPPARGAKRPAAGAATALPRPSRIQFRGGLAPARRDPSGRTEGRVEMTIEIELEQAPVAAGLEKVLQIMDLAVRDERSGK
jgi:hypothetical protein